MTRTDPDRPLTDAQERVLIALAEAHDDPVRRTKYDPDGWQVADYACGAALGRRSQATLIRLEALGLIETDCARDRVNASWGRLKGCAARVTPAGLALLATMGD